MKLVIIVFFVTLLFCNEEEKYTFINKLKEGHRVTYKDDYIMTFNIPGMGESRQGSNHTALMEYLGERDGFYLIQSTLSNITSINILGDDISSDYDAQIINNIPCLLYIDVNGEIDHLETENEYMEDIFNEKYLGMLENNYIYPFGKNAEEISVGDSWTKVRDSIIFFMDASGSESFMSTNTVYTLEKVKSKKGLKIAYISGVTSLNCEFQMIINGEFMDGYTTGTFNDSYRYDIDHSELIRVTGVGKMQGEYEMLDLNFNTKFNISSTTKRIK